MTVLDKYDTGDVVLISGAFRDDADVLADPTEAVLRLLLPDQSESVYRWPTPGVGESSLSHDGVGLFSALHQTETPGVTHMRWEGVGSITGADEDFWITRQSAFD